MVINKNPTNVFQFINNCIDAASDVHLLGWVQSDQIQTINNLQYKKLIEENALKLITLGATKGSKIMLIGDNSPDWHIWDLAIMSIGAISVPILPSVSIGDMQIIINQINPYLVLIDNEIHLDKVQDITKQKMKFLFYIDNEDLKDKYDEHIYLVDSINIQPASQLDNAYVNSISENDTATIVFTSGTTGDPRGAVITHGALIQMLTNLKANLRSHISYHDRLLTFLPLSHILGRCNSLLGLLFGIQNIFSQGQDYLYREFELARPTIFIGVPRVFEKFQQSILKNIEKKSSVHRAYFQWANESSNMYFSKIDSDRAPSTSEILQRNIAYKSVFKPIYERFGGKIRFFVSGGAPLSNNVSRFLRNCNLLVLEGYGLTETIGPCFLSPIQKPIIGAVGLPVGDVKLKIEKDGEILIKSKALFSHYYHQEQATEASFTSDGWYKTGDIGVLNSEGHLVIIDRKKDLIVTSNGKNIAPQKIEKILRKFSLIQEAIVIGDKRPYLTCLILLHKENCISLFQADRHNDLLQLSKSATIREAVNEYINAMNTSLTKHEQLISFHLLTEDISDNPYLMSSSLKVRRQHVLNSFEKEIDAMYNEDHALT